MQPAGKILSSRLAAAAAFLLAIHPADAREKEAGAALRLVCVSSLAENQEIVLASKDEDGEWKEHAKLQLRSSLMSDWLAAQAGELHIAVREEGVLKSIGQFTLPEGARRPLVALVADKEAETYLIRAVDPAKEAFAKGSTLVFNFSQQTGLVSLGSDEQKVEANGHLVLKPAPEENGTYRMMVSFVDVAGDSVLAFDRQVSADPNAREMVFLIPDDTQGIRVMSLPMFGDID